MELKYVFLFAEVNFGRELFVADALSASCAFLLVSYFSPDFAFTKIFYVENSHRAEFFQLPCIIPLNVFGEFDICR